MLDFFITIKLRKKICAVRLDFFSCCNSFLFSFGCFSDCNRKEMLQRCHQINFYIQDYFFLLLFFSLSKFTIYCLYVDKYLTKNINKIIYFETFILSSKYSNHILNFCSGGNCFMFK